MYAIRSYYAYGKGFDAYYERAKKAGVRYIRSMPSAVKQWPGNGSLEVDYALPDGQLISEHFDMVVLSVGMQPPNGMTRLANDLNLGLTGDGFCRTTIV